jgi:hypothetical protein
MTEEEYLRMKNILNAIIEPAKANVKIDGAKIISQEKSGSGWKDVIE